MSIINTSVTFTFHFNFKYIFTPSPLTSNFINNIHIAILIPCLEHEKLLKHKMVIKQILRVERYVFVKLAYACMYNIDASLCIWKDCTCMLAHS